MIEIWNGQSDLRPLAEEWAKEIVDECDIDKGMKDLVDMKEGPESDVFVLRHEDEVVGAMGIQVLNMFFTKEDYSAVRYWYILPKCRYMATCLVNYAKKWSVIHGCTKILMGSNKNGTQDSPTSKTIDKFYEALGMQVHDIIYQGDL
jgi:hypothetical protein